MSLRQPWFLVMAPKAASRFGSHWVGYGTLPSGDVVARLVTSENRRVLTAFGAAWLAATLTIWFGGFLSGVFSLAFAMLATVLVAGIVVASFIRFVCVRMTELPPRGGQSR
jgi:hypothetical protein